MFLRVVLKMLLVIKPLYVNLSEMFFLFASKENVCNIIECSIYFYSNRMNLLI